MGQVNYCVEFSVNLLNQQKMIYTAAIINGYRPPRIFRPTLEYRCQETRQFSVMSKMAIKDDGAITIMFCRETLSKEAIAEAIETLKTIQSNIY